MKRTGNGGIDSEEIRLPPKQISPLFQYPQRLLLAQPALSIEMILQKPNIRLGSVPPMICEELLVCGNLHCWGLDLWSRVDIHPFQSTVSLRS